MGVGYYVYVGAYLEIKADEVEIDGTPGCPNGHMFIGPGPCCSTCGSELVRRREMGDAMLWDLTDREDLTQLNGEWGPRDEVILAIGKLKNKLPDRICDLDTNELVVRPITPLQISIGIQNFQENYAEAIAELREKAEVTVHFGLITYSG